MYKTPSITYRICHSPAVDLHLYLCQQVNTSTIIDTDLFSENPACLRASASRYQHCILILNGPNRAWTLALAPGPSHRTAAPQTTAFENAEMRLCSPTFLSERYTRYTDQGDNIQSKTDRNGTRYKHDDLTIQDTQHFTFVVNYMGRAATGCVT